MTASAGTVTVVVAGERWSGGGVLVLVWSDPAVGEFSGAV